MKVSISWSLPVALMFVATAPSIAAPPTAAAPAKPAPAKKAPAVKLPAGVVATVNGQPIRQAAVDAQLWRAVGEDQTNREVNKTIVRLEAKKRGIKATPQEVQKEFDTQKQRFTSMGRTPADWTTFESRYGRANLMEDMEIQVLANKIGEQEASKITLTDAEKKAATDALDRQANQVHAQHILVGVGPQFNNRTDEEAQKRIKEVQDKLAAGGKWEDLAKEYSDDASNKDNGGDLNFFTRGTMVKEFEDAAFSMKPGEITKTPVKTTFGYHLIRVVDVKSEPVTDAQRQKAIADALTQKREQAKSPNGWFTKIRANYKVVTQMPWDK